MVGILRDNVFAVLALSCAAGFLPAKQGAAEVVQLKSGPDSLAQGWMFHDLDGVCKVATAGHVVQEPDGKVHRPQLRSRRGQEMATGTAIVLSKDLDIAVLPVVAADNPGLCGDGRLSALGVDRRLRDARDLRILRAAGDARGVETIPVRLTATSLDKAGGQLFTVKPVSSDARVVQGWSGAPIRDADGLVGIVVRAEPDGDILAVRSDVIRAAIDNARPVPSRAVSGARPMPGIVTLVGSTIDSDHGYDQILMPDGKGWAVKPDRGVIDFIVKYPSPTAIRRQITLTADSRNSARIIDIDVSTAFSTAGDDWVQVAVCRPSGPDANVFTCPVQPRTISRIKIVARTRTGDPLTITSLSVE